MKPDFFEREIVCRPMYNKAILIDYLPIAKIDKYGNTLSNESINRMSNIDIIKYTCSNNHIMYLRK